MNLTIFLFLFAVAAFFGVSASINRNKDFLLPMAAILILLSGMTLIHGDIEYQDGYNETQTHIDANTTETIHQPVYTSIDQSTSINPEPSTGLSIIMLMVGIYGAVIGVWGRQ